MSEADVLDLAAAAYCGSRLKQDLNDEFSEDAIALAFVKACPGRRWIEAFKQWRVWDGRRWRLDDTLSTYDAVRDFCRGKGSDAPQRDARLIHQAKFVVAVERLARADRRYAARADQWDRDPLLLNTPAGVVDLQTGVIVPHGADRFITKLTVGALRDGEWRELAPTFFSFLSVLTGNSLPLIDYLQRLAGYACTGLAREHVLPFLLGPGGNGKTTFVEALARALGDYACSLPENFLAEQKGDRHPTELADLRGARFAFSSETTAGAAWNEGRLKALTGGDRIKARRMRQDFFEFAPTHTLVVTSNNPPRLRSVDAAIRRRLHVVPLAARVEHPDLELGDRLGREVDGILSWAIAGAQAWLAEGLAPPAEVLAASERYFDAQDPLTEWVELECSTGPGRESSVTPLHLAYRKFMETRGQPAFGRTSFGNELEKRGYPRSKGAGGVRLHLGLELRAPGLL